MDDSRRQPISWRLLIGTFVLAALAMAAGGHYHRGGVLLDLVVRGLVLAGIALGLLFCLGRVRIYRDQFRGARVGSYGALGEPDERLHRAKRMAQAAALFSIATGSLVLVGWLLDVPGLKSVLPGIVAMKVNTAIGLVLAGTSLLLLSYPQSPASRWLSLLLAIGTGLVGLITFSQYAFGVNFGVDQLLFTELPGTVGTLSPGRMAPMTAIAFAVIGTALGMASFQRTVPASQRLALLSGVMGLLPLIGYLYRATNLYGIGSYTQIAIHAALAILILSLGIGLVHPAEGMMQVVMSNTLGGWLLRRLAPLVIGIPPVLGWLRVQGERIGLFEGRLGLALLMLALTVLLATTVWWAAISLTRMDAVRSRAESRAIESAEETRRLLDIADQSRRALLSMMEDQKLAEEHRRELEDQLSHAQKMESIGRLAGGVAHDFNNLMSVILNFTEFAMDSLREGDPLRGDLTEVKKAADRAAALTRQLLAFSRKQVLQPVRLSLNDSVRALENMLRKVLREDIELVLLLATDLGFVCADPGQVEQVLMNLVVNARDAMTDGGKLTIETANVEIDREFPEYHFAANPGPYVRLTVTDSGCGMDEQTKLRLFDPFFTTKEKGKGTGLGLSTVYGIVKQSGGNIGVHSEPGRGTTFRIYLPRDLSATLPLSQASTVPERTKGTETILVVEDEDALRKVAKRSLAAAGYTVLLAANGDEALRVSAQYLGNIDLLLTDIVMPGMNGRLLAQKLTITRPHLAVLFMSGYSDDAIVHHGVLDAKAHFIGKPFTSPDLKQKVREVLDGGTPNVNSEHSVLVNVRSEITDRPLDESAFGELHPAILNELRQAVAAAHYDRVINLLGQIESTTPEVAEALRWRMERFDYDNILDLLGRQRKEGSA